LKRQIVLNYEGIKGSVNFNKKDKRWYGHLLNVDGKHFYDGETLKEIREAFFKSVQGYKNGSS